MRTLPFAPLAERVSRRDLPRLLGCRYASAIATVEAGLDIYQAADVCDELGIHPTAIWTEWVDVVLETVDSPFDDVPAMLGALTFGEQLPLFEVA